VEYRTLGDSDLRVSEICLGTWTTFGGSLADQDAVALVDAAFDRGINFFNTANVYSQGRSEDVLGRALAGRTRDSYVVATKLDGEMPNGDRGLSRGQVLKQIDDSLGRLQLDHVDQKDVIPASREDGVSQIVWSPLAQGVLSGKYRAGGTWDEGTRAAERGDGFMSRYLGDEVLERVQRLRPIADGLGLTTAGLALAWILREPNVASAIVGASRPQQLGDNAAASGVDLDDETLQAIDEVLA
jgi:aryl-alcohol dehydrogenase-like predicted oxidoreductase